MTGPGVFRLNPAGRAERQAPLPAGEGPSGSGGLKQGGTAFLTPLSQAAPGRFYMDIMMDGLRPMPIVEDEEKVMKYDFTAIEQKWQKKWLEEKPFTAVTGDKSREKFYGLIEFPYPSGQGLHVGHARPFTAMDIICRKKRMQGYNVLFPIGYDAFGLPTENYAVQHKIHPAKVTHDNIENFRKQLHMLGYSFDWDREVNTTDPSYYKWTQWIFLQMFKKGLAYKASMPVNWCTSCKIVLANEEVVDGVCERCGGEVIRMDFDPAGIGARSLQECLLIQICRKKDEEKKPNPILELEERIIRECYEEFTRKHWEKIIKKLDIDEETFQEALNEITKLNPRPGASLGEAIGRNLQQIVPDFIVETYDDGTINISLNNRNVPELRMSRDFTEMVEEHTKNRANQSKESKEAMMFLKQKMDAAQGFIDAVRQRQNTLMTTMQAIIDLQRPFFLEGDESLLKPMILKDVDERTGLDISTISRVSNSKYVQTNYGIYPLKFFFSDGYTTEDGEEMSVREIRKILKECIDGEDKKKPLTDDELADILKEKGYPIARRTVAKYRQQLNIPVARLRK